MNDSDQIRVYLLDDHEVVRRGVGELLGAEPDLLVVGEGGSAARALAEVEACRPDVAVLDVRLGDGSGVEVCRDIRSNHPEVGCLMLTSFSDDQALVDAGMAGAAGYVLKKVRGNDIVTAIRKVAAGVQLLDSATVRMALRRLHDSEVGPVDDLTPQERRIFDLIGDGCSNRQIADQMNLAEKTVKNYVSNLLAKLGMRRRTEAAAYAARLDERSRQRYE